ncbi:MAG TPA: glycosyltransferase, partial [bacterium]|nr:glycosyltransferase [bacterium]
KRHRGWMAIWLMDDPLIIWKSRPQLHQLLTTYSIFDMVAVFDSYFIDGLRSHGIADCVHLPLAYDNAVFRPETAEERYAVSFVGENSPHREGVLTGLAGVPLHVWGGTFAVAGSRICHPRITPGEACAVYQSTAVCLNISDPQSIRGNNTRVYEVCGSGGFLLTDYRSELAEQFRIGAEIEVYSSRDKLREKVMYFLDHPATRRQIAAAGAARAARDHTYCCRMNDLLAHLTGGRTLLTSR